MYFQVLSHAGLLVEHEGKSILCDPWLIGSCYWRSWWNYPPVDSSLVEKLAPDCIYLTHVHWDHFQGPSLRLFGKEIPIYIPSEPCGRMKTDLDKMGFNNVIEVNHGEVVELGPNFSMTSYHFGVFLDSCLVIQGGGTTLLNANDTKIMGGPLNEVLKKHPDIDFVFRSHSSANSRLCYEIIDDPSAIVDDLDKYISDFAAFVKRVNPTYAIPFASNQCYLHEETLRFNKFGVTPKMVEEHFNNENIYEPILQVMVSGDSWSDKSGFEIREQDYFENREEHIHEYLTENIDRLSSFSEREKRVKLKLQDFDVYFSEVFHKIPWAFKRFMKDQKVLYVCENGGNSISVEVDFHNCILKEIQQYDDDSHPIQIIASAFLIKHCMRDNLFSHLAISKRVRYRVKKDKKKYLEALNLCNNFIEYRYFPVLNLLNKEFIIGWALRWREVVLYFRIAANKIVLKKPIIFKDYI